jgi:hypothetical protein
VAGDMAARREFSHRNAAAGSDTQV